MSDKLMETEYLVGPERALVVTVCTRFFVAAQKKNLRKCYNNIGKGIR